MSIRKFDPLLSVKNLSCHFRTRDGFVHALNGISFDLMPGELLGIVGESGSGKSVAMMAMIGLLPSPPAVIAADHILFDQQDISMLSAAQQRALRGRQIGFIFQDPMTSLNPVFSVGFQLCEPLRKHLQMSKAQAYRRAAELLDLVGIPDAHRRLKDYPHQFSGGMRQRVMIAMALACDPKLLIADEPTTALDVTIQAQILELIEDLRQKLDMAIIWITHDLGVIAGIADRVMVMYGGQVVEQAQVTELFQNPQHPYTRALLQTIASLDKSHENRLNCIEGQPPILMSPPDRCSFAPRCAYAFADCLQQNPQLRSMTSGQDSSQSSPNITKHNCACLYDFNQEPTSILSRTA